MQQHNKLKVNQTHSVTLKDHEYHKSHVITWIFWRENSQGNDETDCLSFFELLKSLSTNRRSIKTNLSGRIFARRYGSRKGDQWYGLDYNAHCSQVADYLVYIYETLTKVMCVGDHAEPSEK